MGLFHAAVATAARGVWRFRREKISFMDEVLIMSKDSGRCMCTVGILKQVMGYIRYKWKWCWLEEGNRLVQKKKVGCNGNKVDVVIKKSYLIEKFVCNE